MSQCKKKTSSFDIYALPRRFRIIRYFENSFIWESGEREKKGDRASKREEKAAPIVRKKPVLR